MFLLIQHTTIECSNVRFGYFDTFVSGDPPILYSVQLRGLAQTGNHVIPVISFIVGSFGDAWFDVGHPRQTDSTPDLFDHSQR